MSRVMLFVQNGDAKPRVLATGARNEAAARLGVRLSTHGTTTDRKPLVAASSLAAERSKPVTDRVLTPLETLGSVVQDRAKGYAAAAEMIRELLDTWARNETDLIRLRPERDLLRAAITAAQAKCEQYWNEANIGDAEVHAALKFIHSTLAEAAR